MSNTMWILVVVAVLFSVQVHNVEMTTENPNDIGANSTNDSDSEEVNSQQSRHIPLASSYMVSCKNRCFKAGKKTRPYTKKRDKYTKQVCGNDNKTYPSQCHASCYGKQIQYVGKCPPVPVPPSNAAIEAAQIEAIKKMLDDSVAAKRSASKVATTGGSAQAPASSSPTKPPTGRSTATAPKPPSAPASKS